MWAFCRSLEPFFRTAALNRKIPKLHGTMKTVRICKIFFDLSILQQVPIPIALHSPEISSFRCSKATGVRGGRFSFNDLTQPKYKILTWVTAELEITKRAPWCDFDPWLWCKGLTCFPFIARAKTRVPTAFCTMKQDSHLYKPMETCMQCEQWTRILSWLEYNFRTFATEAHLCGSHGRWIWWESD